ncbi:hypothetical protein V6N13_103150 [Hibiscus sabdariffa]|uniref:Uncharacterized protein n=1 Tax=Hibiscus sabdariffa TaxID=183260 RepID=A0ABR2C5P0_9ROSI
MSPQEFQTNPGLVQGFNSFGTYHMNIDGNLEFGSNGIQAMAPVGFSMDLSAKNNQHQNLSKDFQTTYGSFQALLDKIHTDRTIEWRLQWTCFTEWSFPGGPNSMKMVDNANGGSHGSAKASDNGAAMVENITPGNAENIENGVNLFEDGDMDFLSRFFELRNELGPLCL